MSFRSFSLFHLGSPPTQSVGGYFFKSWLCAYVYYTQTKLYLIATEIYVIKNKYVCELRALGMGPESPPIAAAFRITKWCQMTRPACFNAWKCLRQSWRPNFTPTWLLYGHMLSPKGCGSARLVRKFVKVKIYLLGKQKLWSRVPFQVVQARPVVQTLLPTQWGT